MAEGSTTSATGPRDRAPAIVGERRESLWQRTAPIYLALLLAILTVVALLILQRLEHVLVLLFISTLFASAMSPPTDRLARLGVPTGIAVLIVQLGVLVVVAFLLWFVVPPLVEQLVTAVRSLPEQAERLRAGRGVYEDLVRDYPELSALEEEASGLASRIAGTAAGFLLGVPTVAATVLFDLLTIGVISTLIVTNRPRLLRAALVMVHPDDRPQWADVLRKMYVKIGGYVKAKVIVMVVIGLITYPVLLLLDVQYPVPLAIIVGVGETIPLIGVWIARIPLLGIALLSGPLTLGLTFLASFVIENIKAYVVSPMAESEQLDIHPLLVFVSVLVGGALLGVMGAFIAVPAAASVQVLWDEVLVPWRQSHFGEAPAHGVRA